MRICTYNIHGGCDESRRPSVAAIAAALQRVGPDLCLLQEVDRFLPRSGFADQAAALGRELQARWHFTGRIRLGKAGFGNAILSRLPVRSMRRLALGGGGEPRCALAILLENGLTVWNIHLGLRAAWRADQLAALAVQAGEDDALVVGGDFNAGLEEVAVQRFVARLQLEPLSTREPTFPASDPRHRIDFLFGRGLVTRDAGTVAAPGSDHCLVWAETAPQAPPLPGA